MYAGRRFEVIRRDCREDCWHYNARGIPETVVQAAEALVKLMGKDGPEVIHPFNGGIEMEWGKYPDSPKCKFEVIVSEEEGKIEFWVYDYATEDDDPPEFETAEAVYKEYGSRLAEMT